MENYHSTNYTHCPPDDSFFTSPEHASFGAHLITGFSVPLFIYGAYCVLYITPPQMSGAKWVLLMVHFWTVAIDIVVNFLSIPMMFFPSASGMLLGWGHLFGLSSNALFFSIQMLVSMYACATIALFENRQNMIQTRWKIKKTWMRVAMNVFNYTLAASMAFPPYFPPINVQAAQLETLKTIPCPTEAFFDSRVFVITDHPKFITALMCIQTTIMSTQSTFFLFHTWYHLVYVNSTRASTVTRKMQLKFVTGSFIQVTVPVVVILLPVSYIAYAVKFDYYNQKLNNIFMLIFSCHGLMSTICMIAVHKPYREHFVRTATFGKTLNSVKVSTMVSSSHSFTYPANKKLSNGLQL